MRNIHCNTQKWLERLRDCDKIVPFLKKAGPGPDKLDLLLQFDQRLGYCVDGQFF
jgi:hypothetical protein